MSKINANIADYLTRIENLTNTNLQILKGINDSFFTKKNHIYTEVNDTTYVLPSFISLENKINLLQENFENLVKSPETSEAYFNFDGNTRAIEVRKYSHVPDSLKLSPVDKFNFEDNNIFKDFLTPVPYINIDLPNIPNDIVDVNVKKIIPKHAYLQVAFKNKLYGTETVVDGSNFEEALEAMSVNEISDSNYISGKSRSIDYGDVAKLLLNYKKGTDYIEYDTIYKLPIRKNIGSATYVIKSVESDVIDDDLNEIITLQLRNDLVDSTYTNKLTYKLFDNTIEKSLQIGDELINYDGTGKVVITGIRPSTNTIMVKVVNGEYLNFLGTDSYDTNSDTDIHDLSKLRFHVAYNFEDDKYIKIPLEEDQYVYIAVAPLNARMNVQSSWGNGLMINTYNLMNENDTKSFKTYYDENVKNIGDVLFEVTSLVTSPITALTQTEFEAITSAKPELESGDFTVMHINSHLNDSTTVKNIRNAYNQKKVAEDSLDHVQNSISKINELISTVSFNDTTGLRATYTNQLRSLNLKKNDLIATINSAINSISSNVDSADIPIENAKYRIRGFYIPNLKPVDGLDINKHVIGIMVQYRYKNPSLAHGNATSVIGSDGNTYIYSDWNTLNTSKKSKLATCVDGIFSYEYEANNENINEPSYNQLDIPISQGETVDIRLKVIYDYGQPYLNVTSDWSNIINIEFPVDFTKDIQLLDIINQNNADIEANRFNNILENNGINSHIEDMITDQNITYYHKPDSIASGFYTDERRIIPLKDKLESLSNDIALLKSEIYGSIDNLKVSIVIGDMEINLAPNSDNNITFSAYNDFVVNKSSTSASRAISLNGVPGSINGNVTIVGPSTENNDGETTTETIEDENTISTHGAYMFQNGVVSTIANIVITNVSKDVAVKLYPIFPGNKGVTINDSSSKYASKEDYCGGKEGGGVLYRYKGGDKEELLQTQNQFITFRINDPWTNNEYYLNDAMPWDNNLLSLNNIATISKDDKLGLVTYPYLNTQFGLCIDNSSQKSYTAIGPNEEIIIPIMCNYVATENNTSISKTMSFDVRTSLYTDPTNYTFTFVAKNNSSIDDKINAENFKSLSIRGQQLKRYNTTV